MINYIRFHAIPEGWFVLLFVYIDDRDCLACSTDT